MDWIWLESGLIMPWIRVNPGISSLVLGGLGVLIFVALWRSGRIVEIFMDVPREAERVGEVSQVVLYPLKSGRAMGQHQALYCDRMGMRTNDTRTIRDRSWMVALEGGSMISQRAEPRLALVQPSVTDDGQYFQLDAPNMPTLKVKTDLNPSNSPTLDVNVWGLHSDAVHCGEEPAKWLCEFLGKKGFILVYHPPSVEGRTINNGPLGIHKMFQPDNKVAFVEMAPVLLLTEVSVRDVNKHLDKTQVSRHNFRPSVHVETTTDDPYQEDKWDKVYIGKRVVLEKTILAQRCLETTVDPKTGVKNADRDPFDTLKTYRPIIDQAPCLGLFMSVLQEGEIQVGDPVWVTFSK